MRRATTATTMTRTVTVLRGPVPRLLWVLLLALALGAGLPPAPASAHAELVSTVPAANAVLATAPASVDLTFDEPVSLVPDGFQLYDSTGAHRTLTVSSTYATVRATLPGGLTRGSYVLGWRVVSDDSHPESGVLPFSVGEADATAVAVTQSDPLTVGILYETLTALGYLGLFGLVGLTAFDLVVTRNASPGRRLPRVLGLVAVASYAVLVPLTAVREQGGGLDSLFGAGVPTAGWTGAAAGTLALAAGGVALMLLRPRLRPRVVPATGAVGAVVALTSVLPVGHTRTFGPTWLIMASDLVHASAAAVWVGGLVALLLHLARARRRQDVPVGAAAVVGRFSTLAGGVVFLVGVMGTVLAVMVVGSFPALVESTYGRLLLGKIGLVVVVLALAAWNRFRLVPRLGRAGGAAVAWRRLTLALRLEAVMLVLVVGLTSVLTLQNPRATATAAVEPAPARTPVSAVLGTGKVTGAFSPGRVGENVLTFDVTDAAGRPVVPVGTPVVSVAEPNLALGPVSAQVRPGDAPGRYRATLVVPAAGQWRLTVAVRVSELEQPAGVVDVVVLG